MGNLNPCGAKFPEPIVTKIGMGNYVGDVYSCTKFHPNPITVGLRGFDFLRICKVANESDLATFYFISLIY